ncbi:hypothetical protein BGZ96_002050, partial [Linnemannia gamsii]
AFNMDKDHNSKRPWSREATPEGESAPLRFETTPKRGCFTKGESVENNDLHSFGNSLVASGNASATLGDITTEPAVHEPTQSTLPSLSTTPTLEQNIHRLITARLEGYAQAAYIPPDAKPDLQASENDTFPLMDKIKEFIASNGQVFLIMGDSGAGKSTFNRHLEQDLLIEYQQGNPIPLFINLPALDDPRQGMVVKQLRIYGFSAHDIQELKEHYHFILICDGYDETQLKDNLHSTNLLNQKGQWNTKMVISCRSTYLGQDYLQRFQPQPADRYSPPMPNVFQQAAIVPFSNDQIEAYTRQFVKKTVVHELLDGQASWSAEKYLYKLWSVPRLMELVTNPFMLTVALKALPTVPNSNTYDHQIKMTRLSLYQSFVAEWIRLGKLRLLSIKLEPGMAKILEGLLDDGFSSAVVDYLKDVAAAIFQEQDGNPVVHFSPRKDAMTWKYTFFGPESEFTLLRESSPLTRAGIQYQFIHASLLEYFFSCHIVDSTPNLDFTNHPLTQMNLVSKPEVVLFLAEFAQADPDFKQRLFQFIEQSKVDIQVSQAASNAITTLVRASVSFEGMDLRGVRIAGADLSRGMFNSAQLQGADLTGCTLSETWLRHADLSGAILAEVDLGGKSMLECESFLVAIDHLCDQKVFKITLRTYFNYSNRLADAIFENEVGLHPFYKILLDHRTNGFEWDIKALKTQSFFDLWCTFKSKKSVRHVPQRPYSPEDKPDVEADEEHNRLSSTALSLSALKRLIERLGIDLIISFIVPKIVKCPNLEGLMLNYRLVGSGPRAVEPNDDDPGNEMDPCRQAPLDPRLFPKWSPPNL